MTDKNFGQVESVHPELRHMVRMFSDSADNSLFKIEYELDVFIKHQSKMEFGMGSKVTFPIEIKSSEQDLPWIEEKEQTWYNSQSIQAWAPMNYNPTVNLYTVKQPDGKLKGESNRNDGSQAHAG